MSKFEDGHDMSEKYEIGQMQDVGRDEHQMAPEQEGLKRDLRLRHMIMIAISGTIGTGLFLTSGATIATAGPGGALLAYALIGVWLVFVCQAIGEIATLLPLPGAFNAWGGRIFDEAFSFQMTVSLLPKLHVLFFHVSNHCYHVLENSSRSFPFSFYSFSLLLFQRMTKVHVFHLLGFDHPC